MSLKINQVLHGFYFRIISEDCTAHTEEQIKAFITDRLTGIGALDITFSSLVSYWKKPDHGELSCHFRSWISLPDIQQLFADSWREDIADASWSNIHCPNTVFLWISV